VMRRVVLLHLRRARPCAMPSSSARARSVAGDALRLRAPAIGWSAGKAAGLRANVLARVRAGSVRDEGARRRASGLRSPRRASSAASAQAHPWIRRYDHGRAGSPPGMRARRRARPPARGGARSPSPERARRRDGGLGVQRGGSAVEALARRRTSGLGVLRAGSREGALARFRTGGLGPGGAASDRCERDGRRTSILGFVRACSRVSGEQGRSWTSTLGEIRVGSSPAGWARVRGSTLTREGARPAPGEAARHRMSALEAARPSSPVHGGARPQMTAAPRRRPGWARRAGARPRASALGARCNASGTGTGLRRRGLRIAAVTSGRSRAPRLRLGIDPRGDILPGPCPTRARPRRGHPSPLPPRPRR
jgi:hypothetical protein